MSQVILGTLAMMGAAFFIGFVVAYLIKVISYFLNYFENFSFKKIITTHKRVYSISKIRKRNSKDQLQLAQIELNDELLKHFYSCEVEEEENNTDVNELIRYYYGKY